MSKERFEDTFKKLETIVSKLEGGDLSLEDSMKLFEEGMRLSRICSERLAEIQKRVEILLKSEDGSLQPQPFPFEEEKD
ncbi:MAG: exodeoxyribonuclease VII small subunit [Deltaproteobacteria bacterium RBG_13_43_22]|nr:MAG: exodeoxyribonuclease VII small subunit [Deltaproteobacteria bacterium RBG_13_43_22]